MSRQTEGTNRSQGMKTSCPLLSRWIRNSSLSSCTSFELYNEFVRTMWAQQKYIKRAFFLTDLIFHQEPNARVNRICVLHVCAIDCYHLTPQKDQGWFLMKSALEILMSVFRHCAVVFSIFPSKCNKKLCFFLSGESNTHNSTYSCVVL